MKNLWIIVLFTLSLASCKKSDEPEPEPEPAEIVSAEYNQTVLGVDQGDGKGYREFTYPLTVATGIQSTAKIIVTRVDANSVKLVRTQKETGKTDDTRTLGTVTLQKNSTGYDLLVNTTNVGSANGTTIEVRIPTAATATATAGLIVHKATKIR